MPTAYSRDEHVFSLLFLFISISLLLSLSEPKISPVSLSLFLFPSVFVPLSRCLLFSPRINFPYKCLSNKSQSPGCAPAHMPKLRSSTFTVTMLSLPNDALSPSCCRFLSALLSPPLLPLLLARVTLRTYLSRARFYHAENERVAAQRVVLQPYGKKRHCNVRYTSLSSRLFANYKERTVQRKLAMSRITPGTS